MSTVYTALSCAMHSQLIQIETSFARGFAGLQLIGNTSEVCRSGMERAKVALEKVNIQIPQKKLVVSLSPADLPKDGSHFDLPFALSIAIQVLDRKPLVQLGKWLFAAELGLEGQLKPVKGVVSFAIMAVAAGFRGIVVARENLPEIRALSDLGEGDLAIFEGIGFSTLEQVLSWLFEGESFLTDSPQRVLELPPVNETLNQPNFDDMLLDDQLQEIALVVGTGLHSLLLYGTPGTGKSMFSARLTSIWPKMSHQEHVESLLIHSLFSYSVHPTLIQGSPPFRSPHHQASASAVMGTHNQPGELSLAHGGILFLDELPEFRRDIIEGLREPLETNVVRVSRAQGKVTWKAKITLIAACNNCPCGWLGSKKRRCHCSLNKVIAYRRKLSGPILDRIDLHINTMENHGDKAMIFTHLKARPNSSSSSEAMRNLIVKARQFSFERNKKFGIEFNRDLTAQMLIEASGLTTQAFKEIIDRVVPLTASPRSILRSLRVARTLADLAHQDKISETHVQKAWLWQPESAARERGDHTLGITA